jgi:hypothetical protein
MNQILIRTESYMCVWGGGFGGWVRVRARARARVCVCVCVNKKQL